MLQHPTPPPHLEKTAPAVESGIRFSTLLYRFLFFDWLFADMNKAMDLFERHSAWQHNRRMRRYLPIYLWRWSVLTVLAFGLGCLFEQRLGTTLVAAWFFTWSCVTLTGMLVISVLWVFLSNSQTS
jgi:hypothetical protein